MSTHNYSELFDSQDVEMLEDMDTAITKANLWDWMKTYEPEEGKGFMFSRHPNLDIIQANSKYGGHSGGSYAWTMRMMEELAKKGWNQFRLERLAYKRVKDTGEYKHLEMLYEECIYKENKGAKWYELEMENMIQREVQKIETEEKLAKFPTLLEFAEGMRDKLPDGEQQYQAIKQFSEGKMTYAEMRGLCG